MRTVALLGSTGSIGTQSLDVIRQFPDQFKVTALGAGRCSSVLVEQIKEFQPALVVVATNEAAKELASVVEGLEIAVGASGLEHASETAEVTLNAVVGFAGLPVTLSALKSGRRLALANKESLIAAAPLVEKVRSTPGAEIIPVDSEHCAIHQCLAALSDDTSGLKGIVLTASGGPFRDRPKDQDHLISIDDALAHPTWNMGPKITVDSSTLMNKGLEVIEAHALFGIPYDAIDVVIHPQSIVHSMIDLVDGSSLAQLSKPDMRLPIAYALGYPERLPVNFGALDFSSPLTLSFEAPDRDRFGCLALAYEAGRSGGAAPAWLSAANEVAVEAFLEGRLGWTGIAEVVEETLTRYESDPLESLESVLHADKRARDVTAEVLAARIER
jgi:1-deoxy-D-xylulose-5-phosphate reductoisomerase